MTNKEKLDKVIQQIYDLQIEKSKLVELVMSESDTLEEKFAAWYYSDSGKEASFGEFKTLCPYTYSVMEDSLERGTYDLSEYFQEEFGYIADEGVTEEDWNGPYAPNKEHVYKIAREIMEADISSFEC